MLLNKSCVFTSHNQFCLSCKVAAAALSFLRIISPLLLSISPKVEWVLLAHFLGWWMLIPFFSLWCYEQKTNHHNWKVGYWWCLEKWQQLQVASYSSCQSTLDLSCTLLKMASLNFPLHHTEEQLSWWSPSCLLQKEIYAHPTIHPGVSQVNKGGILDFEQKTCLIMKSSNFCHYLLDEI